MRTFLGVALGAWLGLGCYQGPSAVYSNRSSSAGSAALSQDDRLLYVADSDNGIVAVVDTQLGAKIAEVPVGVSPERLVVGPDDTIYVSNRGSRSVSVIQRGKWVEADRIQAGIEPVGLAVSPDNKTLYVVNATSLTDPSTGTLMAFDVAHHQLQWELAVGEEPRGIALLAGNQAVVSLYKQGDLVLIDLGSHSVVQAGSSVYTQLNQTALNVNQPQPLMETLHPHGIANVVVAPDGRHIYAPTLLSSEAVLAALELATASADGGQPIDGSGSGCSAYGGSTNCGPPPSPSQLPGTNPQVRAEGPVVVAGLLTFDGPTLAPQVDDLAHRQTVSAGAFPATLLDNAGTQAAFQEPVTAAVDPTGAWVFVVNRATDNVAILPTSRQGAAFPFPATNAAVNVPVGAGPTGIALSRDGSRAYVHNALDHTVVVITDAQGTPIAGTPIPIAADILPSEVVAGRRLFFSGTNPDVVNPLIGVSCGSCHLEGREDGHVWLFTDGPRQTPLLVGRMLGQTAPYHWDGTLPDLSTFMSLTVAQRMGGRGLSASEEQSIEEFLFTAPAPDSPFRGAQLSAQQIHGAQLFVTAQCSTCHSGATYTNNLLANVGTAIQGGVASDSASSLQLNVPSLLGVGRTAPYLHSGAAATLADRIKIDKASNQHGLTSNLSDSDVADLVAFLQTL